MANDEPSEEDMKNMSAEEIAELQRQNCVFCKIASKEIPARVLHEDSDVICVLDINPASEGHILVFTKKHYMILPHMPADVIGKLFTTVKLMSNTLLKALQCKGTTVFVANGMAAGQKAPHVLVHVFPRKEGDGLLQIEPKQIAAEEEAKIRQMLAPYMQQIFGPGTGNIEIPDKNVEEHKKVMHGNIVKSIAPRMEKKEEIKEHLEETSAEKPEEHEKGPDKPKKGKKDIDLDDISRLFG